MIGKHSPKHAVFFISTGRCGTQWFADKLSTHYQQWAVVKHEPFQVEYKPRLYFNVYHRKKVADLSPAIESHLGFITDTIQDLNYIETGWPVYGALPFIISRLQRQVKIVHLYRHPLKVAASLAAHKVYSRGEWTQAVSISPSDYGVVQNYLEGQRWNTMSEFEKCLFWYTEINHFALTLKRTFSSVPWLSIRFEDVFCENGGNELAKLLDFLALPEKERFINERTEKTDRYALKIEKMPEIHSFEKYPKVVEQMEQLGYQYNDRIDLEIRTRYST
jgi:hypothetical protein